MPPLLVDGVLAHPEAGGLDDGQAPPGGGGLATDTRFAWSQSAASPFDCAGTTQAAYSEAMMGRVLCLTTAGGRVALLYSGRGYSMDRTPGVVARPIRRVFASREQLTQHKTSRTQR